MKEQERGIPLNLSLEEEARETCSSWILIEILNILDSTTKLKRLDVYSELSLVIALKRKRRSVEKALNWETEAGRDQPPRQIYTQPPHATTPSPKPNSPTKCICPSPSYSPFYQKFNNSQSLPFFKVATTEDMAWNHLGKHSREARGRRLKGKWSVQYKMAS